MPEPSGSSLHRELRPLDVTMLVMGGIIGAGIFFTPQTVARYQDSAHGILVAWSIGGVLALTGAIVYAELGGLFPRTGGQYVYLREAYGRPVAFFYGWNILALVTSASIAIICGVCIDHIDVVLRHVLGDTSRPALAGGARVVTGAALIGGFIAVNVRGVRLGANVHNVIMFLKIASVLFVIALGIVWLFVGTDPPTAMPGGQPADPGHVEPPLHDVQGGPLALLAVTLLSVLFSYGGWESVTSVGGEIRDAERVLPRAILVGTISVIVLYVGVNLTLVGVLGVRGLAGSDTPVAAAVGRVLGPAGEVLIASVIVVSTLGIVHALLLMTPRVFYAMARDGVFFEACGRTHPVRGTPHVAIGIFGAFSLGYWLLATARETIPALEAAPTLDELLESALFVDWIIFTLIGGSYFVFRRRRPDADRPFRSPLHPLPAVIFVGLSAAIVVGSVVGLQPRQWLVPCVVLGSGLLFLAWRLRVA